MLFWKKIFFNIKLKKIFFFRIVLFKYARKTQKVGISRGKMSQNVIFCVQKLRNLLFKNIFSSESCFLKNIFLQNLTRRKIFNWKSDAF